MILIQRSGNLLYLGHPDGSPLADTACQLLEPELSYIYKRSIYGGRYDELETTTGYRRGQVEIVETPRRLYYYNDQGQMICGGGFQTRILDLLAARGLPAAVQDVSPEEYRPDRDVFQPDWDSLMTYCSILDGQEDAILALAAHPGGVIKAATGFGKGDLIRMACHLYPRATIHVVTKRTSVARMLVRRLGQTIPCVGLVGDGQRRPGLRVTVFVAGSLAHGGGEADLLLADEVHELAAPSFSRPLAAYHYSRNFGFSATPCGRLDNADLKIESIFGPIIFEATYRRSVELGRVVPIRVEWHDVLLNQNPAAPARTKRDRDCLGIWRNLERNRLVARAALAYPEEVQVLVLVDKTEHALMLSRLLPDWPLVHGNLPEARLRRLRREGVVDEDWKPQTAAQTEAVLAGLTDGSITRAIGTAGVLGTGVDLTHLRVLVRADAGASDIPSVQFGGRLSRLGKEVGVLIDFLDQFDPSLRRKARTRMSRYRQEGWDNVLPARRGA